MSKRWYCVWKDGEEIAGFSFVGPRSACLQYAVMMGGKNWKEKGYHVEHYIAG